jgi:2-methylisocitrate lyase-like PEP mutase family enzyme
MAVNGINTNGHTPTPISAATKLRRIVEDPIAFVMFPGVYDGYSARISLKVGFDGLYMVRSLSGPLGI